MNEKKVFQQKILSQVLMGCGLTILLASFVTYKMNSTTLFGLVFFIIGVLAFQKARRDEERLKK